MNGDEFTKDELLSRFLQLEQRVEELEQENKRKDERIEELEARLCKYENPHTLPTKRRSATDEDDNIRTDGRTPGRNDGHEPEWRTVADPDEVVEVTCDCCPECGEHFDELAGVSLRLVEAIADPHYECESCGTQTVASHPTAPTRGSSG